MKKNMKKTQIGSKRISPELVASKIFTIREQKIMLGSDLAFFYEVPLKRLNEQVKRNPKRFPVDCMFQLNAQEARSLRSQFATLERGRGHYSKFRPYAFTELGIAMLSSVLNSDKAIRINLDIMRAFIKTRHLATSYSQLIDRIKSLEDQHEDHENDLQGHEKDIQEIFMLIDRLEAENSASIPRADCC